MNFLFFTFFYDSGQKNSGMVTFSCFQRYLYEQSHLQTRIWKSLRRTPSSVMREPLTLLLRAMQIPQSQCRHRGASHRQSLHARFTANGANHGVPYNHVGKSVLSECMCMPICMNAYMCICVYVYKDQRANVCVFLAAIHLVIYF